MWIFESRYVFPGDGVSRIRFLLPVLAVVSVGVAAV